MQLVFEYTQYIENYMSKLYIMYNISDFLLVPARNKMYEGAARAPFILAGTSKKSLYSYMLWVLYMYYSSKSKMYCMGVKSIASGLTFSTQSNTFHFLQL